MSKLEIRKAFHQIIDMIDDEECLKDLYDSANIFIESRYQAKLDDFSPQLVTLLQNRVSSIGESTKFYTTEEVLKDLKGWKRK